MNHIIVLLFVALLGSSAPSDVQAYLSVSQAELQRGDALTATVSLYADSARSWPEVTLDAPAGFAIDDIETSGDPETLDIVDAQPQTYRIRVLVRPNEPITLQFAMHVASTAQPSLTPATLTLRVDDRVADSASVRICCARWPSAPRQIFIPLIRKT